MGLDAVELVMDVEDKFDIVIWDEDYGGVVTVGDMHKLIVERLQVSLDPHPKPAACPSMMTFLKIRQFFVSTYSIARKSIRPTTRLESLLPATDRDSQWYKLAQHAKLGLPRLHRTPAETFAVFGIPALLCASPTIVALAKEEPGAAVLTAGVGFIVFLVIGVMLADRIRPRLLPAGCEVVGDLVKFVRDPHYSNDTVTQQYAMTGMKQVDADAVWRDLQQLICEQLGVKAEDVRPEARFVEDLKCG